jgi:hypothetical protein
VARNSGPPARSRPLIEWQEAGDGGGYRLEKAAVERWADATLDYSIDFDAYFADALSALAPPEDDGLVTVHNDAVAVHPKGRLLIRNVAAAFDAYLKQPAARKRPVYSQTV